MIVLLLGAISGFISGGTLGLLIGLAVNPGEALAWAGLGGFIGALIGAFGLGICAGATRGTRGDWTLHE